MVTVVTDAKVSAWNDPFNEAISRIFVINYQTTDLTVGRFALENLIKRKQKEWAANAIEKMEPDLEGMPGIWLPKAKSESTQTRALNYKWSLMGYPAEWAKIAQEEEWFRERYRARVEYVLQKAVYFKEFVFHLLLTEVSESNISLPFVSPFVEPRDAVTWRGHND